MEEARDQVDDRECHLGSTSKIVVNPRGRKNLDGLGELDGEWGC